MKIYVAVISFHSLDIPQQMIILSPSRAPLFRHSSLPSSPHTQLDSLFFFRLVDWLTGWLDGWLAGDCCLFGREEEREECIMFFVQQPSFFSLVWYCSLSISFSFVSFVCSTGAGCNFGLVANKDPETDTASGCGSTWVSNGVILPAGSSCTVACMSGYTSTVTDVYCDGNTFKGSSASGTALKGPAWWDCTGAWLCLDVRKLLIPFFLFSGCQQN